MIGKTVSHYRIVEKLGGGGMGVVYKAEDTRLGRFVALKFLPEELSKDRQALERFQREARAASALNHPNICTIHDIGEHEGQPFIAMELIQGRTLRAMANPRLPLELLTHLGSQAGKALTVAHAAGIIHRDIKPENMMVRDDGLLKMLDFGLARLTPAGEQTIEKTAEGTTPGALLGTVRYMSPEQARGDSMTNATDIFSLGIVLYELATGQHPFAAESQIGVLHAILSQSPLPAARLDPEVSSSLEALILRMLEKDPRLRPTAADVEAALAETVGKGGGRAILLTTFAAKRHTVGREKERGGLRAGFESAVAGHGLLLCVSGEPGIGKTTLIEDFLDEVTTQGRPCHIARGQCSERLAGAEAYLPFLEALESLLHCESRASIARTMRLMAPTWYVQVAPLAADDSSDARLLGDVKSASQERMKRELSAFFQEVARQRPVVLFFDDVHWSDASTVELIAYLATKFESMRTLVVATYRPSDLLLTKHPFLSVKLDLQARGVCREIPLEFLTRKDIERYLALEFPENTFPPALPAVIHTKTEGSPLFMADVVRYLRDRGVIAEEQGRWTLAQSVPALERDLPESVRSMIQRKIDRLGESARRLLMAASVQGHEFDSAVVAKVLGVDAAEVEERLEALDRIHAFVRLVGEQEFPNRALTLRFRFVHVLYQNALYAMLGPTRRAQLSAAAAEALLDYYGDQRAAVASRLAFLFETARDFARASEFLLLASQNAARIFANQEVITLARRGLELLDALPDTSERLQQELRLLFTLGPTLMAAKGYADPEVEKVYARARELCRQVGQTPEQFTSLWGLWSFYLLRAELKSARELGEQCLALAQRAQDPDLLLEACSGLGQTLFYLGEFAAAEEHLAQGVQIYDPQQHGSHAFVYGEDPGVGCRNHSAWALWHLGYPDQALKRSRDALALAQKLSHPSDTAYALGFAARLHELRGEPETVQQLADTMISLCQKHELPMFGAMAISRRGWALAEQGQVEEGITDMRKGLDAWRATGAELDSPYLLALLAEAYRKSGEVEQGLSTLAEALAVINKSEERYCEAETYRLRGELLLIQAAAEESAFVEAESCFLEAIQVARRQSAKSLELRAVMSLSRLLRKQGKKGEAREMLAEIYGWFKEGFDTADLRGAKILLEQSL